MTTIDVADVKKALTLTQLAQAAASLINLIVQAVANGKDGVSPEELAASFAEKDAALVELSESIARAKADGR